MHMMIEITRWETDEQGSYDVQETVKVASKWEICQNCEGCGTDRGASVECDGGGFTSSEWAEQDDDFKSDYLAGVYDKPCVICKGSGKVQVVDRTKVDAELLKILDDEAAEEAAHQAMCAAERRMGA